jgi:Domain of unknown function (DUF4178)
VRNIKNALPAFSELGPGGSVTLGNDRFTVTDLQTAKVIGGDGELPFKVGQGYDAPVVDLQSEEGRLATLDYSDGEKPTVYVGEALEFADLKLSHLRDFEFDSEKQKVKTREFKCKGCGAPLTNRTPDPVSPKQRSSRRLMKRIATCRSNCRRAPSGCLAAPSLKLLAQCSAKSSVQAAAHVGLNTCCTT